MKRKRRSEQLDDFQTCDLILTDSCGRSVRAHKALLIDKSDYFARILSENNTNELQFDENYLIELIQYLYRHEGEDPQRVGIDYGPEDDDWSVDSINSDIEILLQLLALSKKYSFSQLYNKLMIEINYKLSPSTALSIYTNAKDLGLEELQESTKIAILSWLPQLQHHQDFLSLSEESIQDIFSSEKWDVDNECKLNALSAWWTRHEDADMTSLWAILISCSNK